jgi:hypothetical protein
VPYEDHWWAVVAETRLRQGDVFRNLTLPYFDTELVRFADALAGADAQTSVSLPHQIVRGDWILLDASCDVDQDGGRPPAISQLLIARVLPATKENLRASADKELPERHEALKNGLAPNKFLLAPCSGTPSLVVAPL